jgi:hypothetical protein
VDASDLFGGHVLNGAEYGPRARKGLLVIPLNLAVPRSRILILGPASPDSIWMFAGFRSRWIRPCSWM